jgi:hypothetical protein
VPLDGARAGAPGAVQVADRWHLWSNLGDKARETAAAHIRTCLAPARPQDTGPQDTGPAPAAPGAGRQAKAQAARQAKARRRHAEVRQLLDAGHTPAAAARILGLSRETVRKYAAAPAGLPPVPARDHLVIPGKTPPPPRPRAIARWLMTRPASLTPAEAAALAAVTAACPHLARLRGHIAAFADIMTSRAGTAASTTGSPPPTAAASPSCSPSPPASATTTPPSPPASPSPTAAAKSKAPSTRSRRSNARPTAAPASPSCASASCSQPNPDHHEI